MDKIDGVVSIIFFLGCIAIIILHDSFYEFWSWPQVGIYFLYILIYTYHWKDLREYFSKKAPDWDRDDEDYSH